MEYELYSEVVLATDIPAKGLRRGDVATVVDRHPVADGQTGYSLEVFNALGETLAVLTVPESQIKPLTRDDVFTVRPIVAG